MLGSIPARAGEPGGSRTGRRSSWVYPRASGGTQLFDGSLRDIHGLSPRERGNLCALGDFNVGERSIPARAGEPRARAESRSPIEVYPRASGGTLSSVSTPCAYSGLSPRERGNRDRLVHDLVRDRSIPARAGEPPRGPGPATESAVYPRASGGTRCRRGPRAAASGSIPARAGEPPCTSMTRSAAGVYPRASGGTHNLCRTNAPLRRSIPARAGEPLKKHFPAEGRCRTTANVNPKSVSGQTPRPETMCAVSASPNICRRHPQLSWEPRRVFVFVVPVGRQNLIRAVRC